MIKNTVVIFIILQLDALCQLQCQRIAGQAGLFQNIQNRGGDVFLKQLNIRKIDADVQAGKREPPFPAGSKCGAKYPFTNRNDQPALLEQGDKFSRTYDAACRRMKTQQCLHSTDPAALTLQLRLVAEKKPLKIMLDAVPHLGEQFQGTLMLLIIVN